MTEQNNSGNGSPRVIPPADKPPATLNASNAPQGKYRLVMWGTSSDGITVSWIEGDFTKFSDAVDLGHTLLNAQTFSFSVFNENGRRLKSRNISPLNKFVRPISVTALAGLAYTGDQLRSKNIKPKTGEYRRK